MAKFTLREKIVFSFWYTIAMVSLLFSTFTEIYLSVSSTVFLISIVALILHTAIKAKRKT